jgi:hypothetical protein
MDTPTSPFALLPLLCSFLKLESEGRCEFLEEAATMMASGNFGGSAVDRNLSYTPAF